MRRWVWLLLFPVGALLASPAAVRAQEAPPQAVDPRDRIVQELLKRVESLEAEVRALRDAAAKSSTGGAPGTPPKAAASPTSPAEPSIAPPLTAQTPPGTAQPETPPGSQVSPAEPSPPAEEEREVTRVPLVSVERGGSLLRPGTFQVEGDFSYTHTESTRLIVSGFSVLPLIVLGSLESERDRTDSISPSLTLRYGLWKDLQGDLSVPLAYQTVSRVRLSSQRSELVQEGENQFGLGDMQFGLTYQPLYEREWIPDVTMSLRALAPIGRSQFDIYKSIAGQGSFADVEDFVTRLNAEGLAIGSGFWGLTGSVSATKAFDPVILFGTLGYTYNFSDTKTLIQIIGIPTEGGVSLHPQAIQAKITPGDSVFFTLGGAIALTNQVSVNLSFSDRITFPTASNGKKLAGSSLNVGGFNVGFNLAVTPQVSLGFTGTIGLTPDAQSFSLGLSVIRSFASFRELWPFGQ